MSRRHYVEETIQTFGAGLEIPDLSLDDSDRASFSSDGIHVTFSYATEPVETLWIFVDLGEIPENDVNLLSGLLQASYAMWTSNLMTIGINDSGERALGYTSIPVISLNFSNLFKLVEKLLEAAKELRSRIESGNLEISVPA